MFPGNEVRLKHAYIVKCTLFKKNETTGKVEEVHCKYYPETKGGTALESKKIKGTISGFQKKIILYLIELYH